MTRSFECPHCGTPVPRGRMACPECGSDAGTGWLDEEEVQVRSVDIPDHLPADIGPRRMGPWTVLVVGLLAGALVLGAVWWGGWFG